MCPQLLNTLDARCFNSELDNERIESLHLSIYFGTIASKIQSARVSISGIRPSPLEKNI